MATILVIDDEPIVRDLISTILRLDGHDVQVTSDPLAVFDFLGRTQSVDLLLTDVIMHPIGGFELVRRLGKSGCDIPVLFLSGDPGLLGAVSGGSAECSVLEKPFTASSLRRAVSRLLAGRKSKYSCATLA